MKQLLLLLLCSVFTIASYASPVGGKAGPPDQIVSIAEPIVLSIAAVVPDIQVDINAERASIEIDASVLPNSDFPEIITPADLFIDPGRIARSTVLATTLNNNQVFPLLE